MSFIILRYFPDVLIIKVNMHGHVFRLVAVIIFVNFILIQHNPRLILVKLIDPTSYKVRETQ